MSTDDTVALLYRSSIIFAALASIAVPVTYQILSSGEWRKHAYGRHLMGSDSVIAATLAYVVFASFVDNVNLRRMVGVALITTLGIYRIQRVRFMRRSTQSTGYDNKDAVYGENVRDNR